MWDTRSIFDWRRRDYSKRCPRTHKAVDAFWRVWMEVGEPHKHGVYESTWMAIDAALKEETDE